MLCDEKKKFKSEHAALTHLHLVQGRKKNHLDQHPYLCNGIAGCYFWHLTTEFDHSNARFARRNKYHKND